MQHPALGVDPQVAHGGQQIGGDVLGPLQRAAFEQQCKFVAAQAGQRVGVTHPVEHGLGDLAQHFVAGGVSAGVVDQLEAVEVDEAHHVRAAAGLPRGQGGIQAGLEPAPVHQPGQRVVAGLPAALLHMGACCADVAEGEHPAGGAALRVMDDRGPPVHRDACAVALQQVDLAVDGGVQRHRLAAGAVGQLQQVGHRPASGVFVQPTCQLPGCRVGVADPALHVDDDHAVGDRTQGHLGAFLLLEQVVGGLAQLQQRGLQRSPGDGAVLQVVHQLVEGPAQLPEFIP